MAFKDVHYHRPWNRTDAEQKSEYIPVSYWQNQKEDIDLCLNCKLPASKCFGNGYCYGGKRNNKVHGKFDREEFLKACQEGTTTTQIARILGVARSTVTKWKKKYMGGGDI